MRNFTLALIVAIISVGLGACASPDGNAPDRVLIGSADELLPGDNAKDWVTYSDHVAIAQVSRIEMEDATREELEANEGFIPRTITFAIAETIWSRPGARKCPNEITIQIDGSTFKSNEERPLRFDGEPMITLGSNYVIPIVFLEKGRLVSTPAWSNLTVSSILPIEDDTLGRGDSLPAGLDTRSAIAKAVWDKPSSFLVELLERTAVPNVAERYMGLPPTDRFQAVSAAHSASGNHE